MPRGSEDWIPLGNAGLSTAREAPAGKAGRVTDEVARGGDRCSETSQRPGPGPRRPGPATCAGALQALVGKRSELRVALLLRILHV